MNPTIQYPYMPEGRTILYVPETDEFMLAAKKAALSLSTDGLKKTGLAVVKDGKILAIGANQTPIGKWFPSLIPTHPRWCIRKLLKVRSGTKYALCPGCSPAHHHAEQEGPRAAIKQYGADAVKGADVYLWGHWWCCKPCWDAMIGAGIRQVYLMEGSEKAFR